MRAGPRCDAGGRGRRHRLRAPPGGAGRYRHGQDARLPGPRHPLGPAGGGGHRHQGPAGPAGRQGPARSSTATSTSRSGPSSRAGPTTPASSAWPNSPVARAPPGVGDQLALDGLAERADPDELAAPRHGPPLRPRVIGPSCRSSPPTQPGAPSVPARGLPRGRSLLRGDWCFAEAWAQAEADVVVVNPHLYGFDLAADGALLPDHEVAVVDEAHQLDDIISATTGACFPPGRFPHPARPGAAASWPGPTTPWSPWPTPPASSSTLLSPTATGVSPPCRPTWRARWPGSGPGREGPGRLRAIPEGVSDDVTNCAIRARQAASALLEDLDAGGQRPRGARPVRHRPGTHAPALRLAPLDVAVAGRAVVVPPYCRPHQRHPGARLRSPCRAAPGADELLDVGSPDFPTRPHLLRGAAPPAHRSPLGRRRRRRAGRPDRGRRCRTGWPCSPATRP